MATKNVEAIYPLSPLQQGLLFHALYSPKSEEYFEQLNCRLEGEFQISSFKRAWQQVIDRHPTLRTAFVWEGLKKNLQVVVEQVGLPLKQEDWRDMPAYDQQRRVEEYLLSDRQRGFELSKAPLMRLMLIQLDDSVYHFIWSFHHLLLDGWSGSLVINEVFLCYEAYKNGRKLELELPRAYHEYIDWLEKQDREKAESYWRRVLEGFKSPTLMRLGENRNESGGYQNKIVALSEELSERLRAVAQRRRLTLNTLVQGAWGILLSRYSGEEDVVFGATVSGRESGMTGIESMVGLFINTLPVRVRVRGEREVVSLLKQLQEEQVEARQYEYSSLAEVQKWSEIGAGERLFETLVVYENYPIDRAMLEKVRQEQALKVREIRTESRTNYPLSVVAWSSQKMWLRLAYHERQYDEVVIERMAGHLQGLLGSIAIDSERRVWELQALSAREKHQLLVEWNQTEREYKSEKYVHELFTEQAGQTLEQIALISDGQCMSYGELNRRANQLARYLQGLGVGPEVLVGLCLERSVEMVVALLGVLKAGGAYLPLDSEYPLERLSFMLEDAGAGIVVSQRGLKERLLAYQGQTVLLDEEWERISENSESEPESSVEGNNLAYAIYTSGSTGRPKGVMIEHKGLRNLVGAQKQAFRLGEHSRALQFASLSFDASVWEIFSTLAAGGSLHVYSRERLMPGDDLLRVLKEDEITIMTLPPTVLAALEPEGAFQLQTVIAAGEACGAEVVERWAQGRSFIDAYGPTEATVCASMGRCEEDNSRKPTIGRPIANMQLYILDRDMEPVPLGVQGELHVSGVGLARGYIGKPDVTAERFAPNQFSQGRGERLYRTGDLGRYLLSGEIDYIGRVDEQVKVRGYRIELGEIEARLCEHAAVAQAAVIARKEGLETKLVGYVVMGDGEESRVSELREYLKKKLPEYMVPGVYVRLGQLPLTRNGKIDRNALLESEPDAGSEWYKLYASPRNPVEELLKGIWAEVLGVAHIGIHDNFFEIGGHSLLATQLLSRIHATFHVTLSLRRLFNLPTIAEQAEHVEAMMKAETRVDAPPVPLAPRDSELPLSFAQSRLWFIDQLDPGNTAYNSHIAFKLEGSLNIRALRQSFRVIVKRHESLRTTFPLVDGRAVQVISPTQQSMLPLVDLCELTKAEREMQVLKLATEESRMPFDLASGPLIRTTLLRLTEDEHAIFITMHLIIADGWSIGVLKDEMTILYRAICENTPPALPELPIQCADYARWQRDWLQGDTLDAELSYWKQQLGGDLPVLELPTNRTRPTFQTFAGAHQPIALSKDLTEKLKAISRQTNATLFMTLLAAFYTLLYRYTGQQDIIIGSPIANRNRVEAERLIGFFVNTLALRASLSDTLSFRKLLNNVCEVCLGAYVHQVVPFEKLVEELQPERNLSHTLLFQVMFVFQNTPREDLELSELRLSRIDIESGVSKFDLMLDLWEGPNGLSGAFEYNRDLFDASMLASMAEHFEVLLKGIIANPDQAISKLPLMTELEQHKILVKWNDTKVGFPDEFLLHEFFWAQLEERGDQPAIITIDRTISYRQLSSASNHLARHLRSLGARPNSLVAIAMHKGWRQVAASLAILQAGAAYLPLDPSLPPDRFFYLLDQSEAHIVVTQPDLLDSIRWPDHVRLVCVEESHLDLAPTAPLAPVQRPDDLAYLIYTSGSTGLPKGVMIDHRGPVNTILDINRRFAVTSSDRVMALSSLSFDLSVYDIFGTLAAGAAIVVPEAALQREPSHWAELAARAGVTVWNSVPALMEMMVEQRSKSADPRLGSLRLVMLSGDWIPLSLPDQVRQVASSAKVVSLGGATEASIWSILYEVEGVEPHWRSIPYGRPMSNQRFYVLNEQMEVCPVWVKGELYIGGVGLAKGYWKDEGKSSEKFVRHPKNGERLYRTGDMGRYTEEGEIEFLGREDLQVKVGGHRIELGEVEAALLQHPGVAAAAVSAEGERQGAKRLIGYVVMSEAERASEAELRQYLREKLPEYMVPARVVQVARMPLTTNGKLDRKALPAVKNLRPELETSYVMPQTELEQSIAAVWQQVLKVDKVGIHDNFFDLGGNSLLMIQVHSKLRQVVEDISVIKMFQYPTISYLAKYLSQDQPEQSPLRQGRDRAMTRLELLQKRSRSR
jgi:amino acid adenylation domain-containing protein